MAMIDWNDDGKNDIFDDFIEYKIYEDVMKDYDDKQSKPSVKRESDRQRMRREVEKKASEQTFGHTMLIAFLSITELIVVIIMLFKVDFGDSGLGYFLFGVGIIAVALFIMYIDDKLRSYGQSDGQSDGQGDAKGDAKGDKNEDL